jgi:hypothetical protein
MNVEIGTEFPEKEYINGIFLAVRFVSISAKFGICTVVALNGTLVEAKTRAWGT